MPAFKPPSGFAHLILLPHEEAPFYLEIPIETIVKLCLKPRKYLRYLGWCILGITGALTNENGEELDFSAGILDQAIYNYVVPIQNTLAHAVDPEATKPHSRSEDASFEIPKVDRDYGAKLQARDGRCVWTSTRCIVGAPIIPHEKGDEWLQLIIANRPNEEGLNSKLRTVDFENGFCASPNIRVTRFGPRDVAVLKTPNPILDTTDVPAPHERPIAPGLSFPSDARYTLQWLVPEDPFDKLPNNSDATFQDHQLPRPSDLLLHYNYGAAAVKNWGRNTGVLVQRPDLPRPRVLPPRHKSFEAIDSASGEETEWDEDDVMMFLITHSRPAIERREREQREQKECMEGWLAEVNGPPAEDDGSPAGADGSFSEDDDYPFDGGHYP